MSVLFTSESVCKGHPDKICDQIADRILDACLEQDKDSHVACEVCCTTGTVVLMGEISTNANVDYKSLARSVIKDIGYTDPRYGLDSESCSVVDLVDKQSAEINDAVLNSLEMRHEKDVDPYDLQGAGDQGIIFGYACDETEDYMPLTMYMADKLARRLEYVRETDPDTILRPDGKTQVTVQYDDKGNLMNIDTILISTQHHPNVDHLTLESYVYDNVIKPVVDSLGLNDICKFGLTKYIINPSGSFTIGGPQGDTGLTGRKLAVDTYGGHAKFGGGAMSGKCPSKVDRSAAYMARYTAKHIVASGLARKCEVQVSYAIGMATPVSLNVNTYGTSILPDDLICANLKGLFDFRPLAIIDTLDLKTPNYYRVASRCHFGNNVDSWEVLNPELIDKLKEVKFTYMNMYNEK